MNYNDITFPHPVLRKNDDSVRGHIDISYQFFDREDDYLIKIDFKFDNEDILNLIKNGKAEYSVEVICSNTLYRRVYVSRENSLEFNILKTDVKGKVEFESFILAKENIPKYKNKDAHPDYNDFIINIKQGDVLAYFGGDNFTAHINYKKLKAVASFMEVIEGNKETVYVNLDSEKILIELPKEDYKLFKQDAISKEIRYVPVIHSSIVLNALLIAMYNIDEFSERLWAKALKYRLENEDEFKTIPFDNDNIPDIAQRLLGQPFTRLIEQLDENLNQYEDE